jgi:hypothetical protein
MSTRRSSVLVRNDAERMVGGDTALLHPGAASARREWPRALDACPTTSTATPAATVTRPSGFQGAGNARPHAAYPRMGGQRRRRHLRNSSPKCPVGPKITHRFGSPCLEHIHSITDAAKARRDASGHQPGQRFPVLALKSGPFLLRCMSPVLARLRRSHQRFECRLIGAKPA